MEIVPFIAESASDAARQVRARLGPEAVVVQVRPVEAGTRSWFGKKTRTRFEVLAYRPDPAPANGHAPPSPMHLDMVAGDEPQPPAPSTSRPREQSPAAWSGGNGTSLASGVSGPIDQGDGRERTTSRSGGGNWRAGGLLEASGFLPQAAQSVVDALRKAHGDMPPVAMAEELNLVRRALKDAWRKVRPMSVEGGEVHVLVGAPGVGKTTCLSKWLTQVALGEGRPVRVWRLDGQIANTAEALAVYCDVLSVPLARRWNEGDGAEPGETGFVDLPGTDWRDAGALAALGDFVRNLGPVRVHLVVNGAYDLSLMMGQVRAFASLPIEDVLVTHLDEEGRWGKLWNVVLGTNYSVRYLSAGQNVPGDFQLASPEALMARQFPG